MGLLFLAFLLFSISLSCVNSALFNKEISILEQFGPEKEGCNVNWILDKNGVCAWCERMFEHLIQELIGRYTTFSVYTEIKEGETAVFDLKGTCFINWFMFMAKMSIELLFPSIVFHRFSENRNEDWFIFLDVRIRLFHRCGFMVFTRLLPDLTTRVR